MLKILTLNWNGKEKISALYKTMQENISVPYEWHIKDNGSVDGSIDEINSWNKNYIYLHKVSHNRDNFSEGMNFLFKESAPDNNDDILLLNNDVLFKDSKSLNNMISILKKDNTVGAVGAKLLFTNSNKIQHVGVVFNNNKLPYHYKSNEEASEEDLINREYQCVTGAVFLTNKRTYENICVSNKSGINGLSEKLVWAFDDVDACLSIKYNQNKKIVYCGNTCFFHEESASLKKNPTNKLFMNQNINRLLSSWADKIIVDQLLYKNNKYNIYTK